MTVTEANWKRFKVLKAQALERYCQAVLDDAEKIGRNKKQTAHERYLELFTLIDERNEEMGKAFDGHSRSKVSLQLYVMRQLELITDADYESITGKPVP